MTEQAERISRRSLRWPVHVKAWARAGLFNFLENFIFIFVLALFYFSYKDGVGRDSLGQKVTDNRYHVQLAFQARDAARQAEGEFVSEFRIGHVPAREPFAGRGSIRNGAVPGKWRWG